MTDPLATEAFLQAVMERRAGAGLRLEFAIPGRPDTFVCYPRDGARKARLLASAKRKGWRAITS